MTMSEILKEYSLSIVRIYVCVLERVCASVRAGARVCLMVQGSAF